jgi:hypothetical protein
MLPPCPSEERAMSTQSLNEETVKNRYLLPYLERLGLNREDLSFESSFTLQLGRQKGQPPIRGGRLDILVRRGTANLMVVEVKAEGESLTDDDCRQAISYASLLDQIAPLSLATNGSDFRLFETISRQQIRPDEVDPQKHFQIVLPPNLLAIRQEALRLFLGYSAENVAVFCRAQVNAGLSRLRGSAVDRNKKYIPELFVPRGDLRDQVASFLSSPLPLFVLVGDSGLGKTCSLCATTESLLDDGVAVLFYRGSILPDIPLLQAIGDDFAWTFTEEDSERNLVRRLESVLSDRPLVVVIDAIDEWTSTNRMQDLLLTARRLSGSKVKILLSCKVRVWPEFSMSRGEATGIDDILFGGTPYRLPPMSKEEFYEAIKRYSSFYSVRGVFEDTALVAAEQSPFLFRVLFEVAEQHGEEYLTFSSLQFFHVYYDQLIARLDDSTLGDLVLRDVARLMYEQNAERIRLYDLSRAVGLEKVRAVLDELLQFQLFEITQRDGEKYVTFYFSVLRDYLVAFRVYSWQVLPADRLLEVFREMSGSAAHIEALAFFYRYATPEQKRVVDSSLYDRAKAYTELYYEVLRTDFPRFRDRFSPYTQGEIGFVGEFLLDRKKIELYGFRKRNPGDEAVLLLPYPRYRGHSNLPYFYGAVDLHSYSTFRGDNFRDGVLNDEVLRRLQRIIDNGLLDESCCPELAAETVAVEVARDRAIFSDKRHAHSAGPVFPLDVARVRYWLRYELLHYYFEEVRREEKLHSGEVEVERHGDHISYNWSPTLEDMDWTRSQVEAHVYESEEEVRQLVKRSGHEDLKRLDARVSRACDILEHAGIKTIEEHPFGSTVEYWSKMWHPYQLTIKNSCCFIEEIFTYVFPIIRRMVEQNFPTLAIEFQTLSRPFVGIAAVNLDHKEAVWHGATIYLCDPDPGQRDVKFIARNYRDIERRISRDPDFRFEVCCDGIWRARQFEGFIGQRSVHFSTLFRPGHDYLGYRHNVRPFGPVYPVIRAVVYDWIREELAAVFGALCEKYGVKKRDSDWTFFTRSRN